MNRIINATRLIACIVVSCPLCHVGHTYFGSFKTGDKVKCQKGRGEFELSFYDAPEVKK